MSSDLFAQLETKMPMLLNEMRQDLALTPLKREVVLLEKSWIIYNAKGSELRYNMDQHPDLLSQFQILQNYGLVTEITYNSVTRYSISETLAAYLRGELQTSGKQLSPPIKGFTG